MTKPFTYRRGVKQRQSLVPPLGNPNQVLAKSATADGAFKWADAADVTYSTAVVHDTTVVGMVRIGLGGYATAQPLIQRYGPIVHIDFRGPPGVVGSASGSSLRYADPLPSWAIPALTTQVNHVGTIVWTQDGGGASRVYKDVVMKIQESGTCQFGYASGDATQDTYGKFSAFPGTGTMRLGHFGYVSYRVDNSA
jgi:hypothetical protein